ncbi:hypothetical protein Cylst_5122 [Cylindrospermum stagnale PCC 7417]|uniref:Uncharacterized protein n=1 Tax=Cylindrospermum stagnale PCC 7417 TaxID=56107 RepID=K9X6B0_9NOST|nr:hypothetical protein Cylst_5122 [Cylindrospermum stagnale PCC 7417]
MRGETAHVASVVDALRVASLTMIVSVSPLGLGLGFPSGLGGEQVLTRFFLRLARCILEVVNFGQIIKLNVVVTIFKHKLSN